MEINDILTSIPSIIGSLFDNIYVISKELDKCYLIEYTGDELKVSPSSNYESFTSTLSVFKDNLIDAIENKETLAGIYITNDSKEKIIKVVTKDKYKIVLISSLETSDVVISDKKKLLIADDSPVISKFFTKIFKDDYDILVASNGEEAIKLIEENISGPLVGAFIDLQMPVKNGYEVLEYFKQNNLFQELPVSVISGEDSQDGIEKATAYGIVDMLQKPFSAEAAKSIVSKTISFSKKNQ